MSNPGGKVVANLRKKFVFNDVVRWFPGHMSKGLRQMQQQLKNIDCVIEVHDARVPISGRYVDFRKTLTTLKPHILVLSKLDLADDKYKESIMSTLNRERLSNVIFTNLKKEQCKGMKKILPLATDLIKNSNRFNRITNESYTLMVIGVPNVGKSSLINRLRNNHLRMSKASPVGPIPGVTRAVLTQIKISENPKVYLLDTPGILAPSITNFHTGFKLALVGCIQDNIIGIEMLADYLLYWLNRNSRFEYVEKFGLQEPNDNVTYVLTYIAAKLGKTKTIKYHDGLQKMPDLHSAADCFISSFRKGELGRYCLDNDLLEKSQERNVSLA
ncbi:mitochondrial GTPase 1 [Pseudomyrmex gracilis]|uniref:mitochondrial GTPase 1 n=1 Tax=Pseudomyrmex gracilis TaxID=219809 RepID=UPI000994AFC1|nr:mitochondrial GTPase 1 [Pseudomyrmex gracilis]XP_020280080.1 mitochondrial GTPase 1 [Pseudomyrmex gracilis]